MRHQPRPGFTLVELIIVIALGVAVITVLLLWATMATGKSNQIRCAANLRKIGQAMQLYAQDNLRLGGCYPRLHYKAEAANIVDASGSDIGGAWTAADGNPFSGSARDGTGTGHAAGQSGIGIDNIPAALFLLVRTQRVSPDDFVCPSSSQNRDDLQRGGAQRQLRECGNFGSIRRNLSYGYANPYPATEAIVTGYRLTVSTNPEFAILADMGPGTANGQNPYGIGAAGDPPATANSPWPQQKKMNSLNHGREGQNVLFADGHVDYMKTVFCGIKGNNIYVSDTSEGGTTVYRAWLGAAKEAKVRTSRSAGANTQGTTLESAFDPSLNQSAAPGNTTTLKGTDVKPCSGEDSVLLPWESDN